MFHLPSWIYVNVFDVWLRGRRESRRDFERRVDLFVAWLSQRQEKAERRSGGEGAAR